MPATRTTPTTRTRRAGRPHARGLVAALVAVVATTTLGAAAVRASADDGSTTRPAAAAVLYRSPLTGAPDVRRAFEAPPHRWAAGHRGADLAAAGGQVVVAPADGVVAFAGTVVDRGVLTLTHPDGRRSSLEPVRAVVAVGTAVRAGDVVAVVTGSDHCGPVACLHWGVREGEVYVDPLGLLPGGGPVVLLPRDEP